MKRRSLRKRQVKLITNNRIEVEKKDVIIDYRTSLDDELNKWITFGEEFADSNKGDCPFGKICKVFGKSHQHNYIGPQFIDDSHLFALLKTWYLARSKYSSQIQRLNEGGQPDLNEYLPNLFSDIDGKTMCYVDASFCLDFLLKFYSNYSIEAQKTFDDRIPSLPLKLQRIRSTSQQKKFFTMDVKMFDTEIKNAVIFPCVEEYILMNKSLFYSKFSHYNLRILKHKAELTRDEDADSVYKLPKFIEGYRIRGVFTTTLSWGNGKRDEVIRSVAIVEDCPFQLVLPKNAHAWFNRGDQILGYQYDEMLFERVRQRSGNSEVHSNHRYGIVTLKRASRLIQLESFNFKKQELYQDPVSVTACLLTRFNAAMKKCLLTAKIEGKTFSPERALLDPIAENLRGFFDFLVHTLRALIYLPKGKQFKRSKCSCPQYVYLNAERLITSVALEKAHNTLFGDHLKSVTAARPRWVRHLVLEVAPGHLHHCSSIRCPDVEGTEGNVKVCELCLKQNVLAKHYYCSKECQMQEWKWSHKTFHYLVGESQKLGS